MNANSLISILENVYLYIRNYRKHRWKNRKRHWWSTLPYNNHTRDFPLNGLIINIAQHGYNRQQKENSKSMVPPEIQIQSHSNLCVHHSNLDIEYNYEACQGRIG
mmetsp:Transcript_25114/g.36868  ORF Transcript_25114/g.36868 Transcript_25114/m.36868 type:complete len:105 (+) Transcript_25114:17-331(+)